LPGYGIIERYQERQQMSVISASGVAVSYGAHDVFSDLSFDVPPGAKIALVGPNGSGKTSLLRILARIDRPAAGRLHWARDLTIGYLPQIPDLPDEGTLWDEMLRVFEHLLHQAADLRRLELLMAQPEAQQDGVIERYGQALEAFELAGGYTYELEMKQVLTGLGFDDTDYERPLSQMSGGQKTRALLARLLLQKPDLLLLDEPTNHLDIHAVEWLEGYLREWPGTVITVAHDRAFLDQVVDRVWELNWGRLESYPGNYSQYVTLKVERMARRRTEYERQQEFITKEQDFIRRHIAGQRTREAQGRRKRLERLERLERPRERRRVGLDLRASGRSGDLVLGLYELAIGYDPRQPLFTCDEVELRRGQRVALIGPNGSGKTTFLRTVLGELRPLRGRLRIGASVQLGYFAQARSDLRPEHTVLESLLDARHMPTGEARDLLGRYLFSGDEAFKQVADLSGGEQSRLALARLTLQGANVLLLDEPTNHLDIPSQEVLQQTFLEFEGTILLVSHDRYLISALSTAVWAIEDGQLYYFKEGYPAYRAWLAQRREAGRIVEDTARTPSALEREATKAAQREAAQQARELQELEQTIHRLEAHLAHLSTALEQAGGAQEIERVRELGLEYREIEAELQGYLAKWSEVAA
jgi:ATP-binding cassette subfamily F protein 3